MIFSSYKIMTDFPHLIEFVMRPEWEQSCTEIWMLSYLLGPLTKYTSHIETFGSLEIIQTVKGKQVIFKEQM